MFKDSPRKLHRDVLKNNEHKKRMMLESQFQSFADELAEFKSRDYTGKRGERGDKGERGEKGEQGERGERGERGLGAQIVELTHRTNEAYPEYTDIGWLGRVSTGTADVSVEFELLLVDN